MKVPNTDFKDISFNLSNYCLSSCKYCGLCSPKKWELEDEMSMKDMEAFLIDPILKGLECIHLTGGETFLSPRLLRIADIIYEHYRDVPVNLPTNALYPHLIYHLMERIIKKLPQWRLNVGVEGPCKEIHDRIRGKGSWTPMIETLRKLKPLNIPTVFNMTCYRENHAYIRETKAMADSWGAGFYLNFGRFSKRFGNEKDAIRFYGGNQDKVDTEHRAIVQEMREAIEDIGWLKERQANREKWAAQTAKWEGKKVKWNCLAGIEGIDVFSNGDVYPCLPEGSEILTSNGYEKIETIKQGEDVLDTHSETGVLNTMAREYEGDLVGIKCIFFPTETFRFTPEHPILVGEREKLSWKKSRPYSVLKIGGWKKAANLSLDDYVLLPKNKEEREIEIKFRKSITSKRKIPNQVLDNSLASLFGWYLAEGSITSSTLGVAFSLGKKEIKEAREIQSLVAKLGLHSWVQKGRNYMNITASSRPLAEKMIELFGKGAKNKHLPTGFLFWRKDILESLIDSLRRGDGYEVRKGEFIIKTSSHRMAREIQLALFKIGYPASISRNRPSQAIKKSGEIIVSSESWSVYWNSKKSFNYEDEDYWYLKVKKIDRKPYSGRVYNLETCSNLYLTPFVVHNCLMYFKDYCFGNIKEGSLPISVSSSDIGHPLSQIMHTKKAARIQKRIYNGDCSENCVFTCQLRRENLTIDGKLYSVEKEGIY